MLKPKCQYQNGAPKSPLAAAIINTVALIVLCISAHGAAAAEFLPASGDYANPANWNPAGVPTAAEAVIGRSNTEIATYNTATSYTNSSRLLLGYLGGGNGTLNMNPGAGTLTYIGDGAGVSNFIGVDGGTGTLNVSAGTLNFGTSSTRGYLRIGSNAGSNGLLNVSGGTVNISTSANMGARYDNGNAAVSSSGTLTISGNGVVNIGTQTSGPAPSNGLLGYLYMKNDAAGSTGTATVNLNGGTLSLVQFAPGTVGTTTVNLNGGTLQARGNTTTFMQGLTAANVQAGGAVFDTNGYDITVNQALLNAGGGLTKNSAGTLTLTNTGNSFTGPVVINGGTLQVGTIGPAQAVGILGTTQQITVNNGGTLLFAKHDEFGNAGANPTVTVTINQGGTVTNSNTFTTLGVVNLNGGTLAANGGANGSYQSFALRNNVNVNGSVTSTISATGANSSIHLGQPTGNVFNVANGAADIDLHVSAPLINSAPGAASTNSLVKEGTGKMVLSGANTYSGTTAINNGTLLVNGTHTGGGAYTVAGGATLGGSGTTTSLIQGAGQVSPGNSPGILTVGQIDPSGGMDYSFEFTATGDPAWNNAASSVNDVLRVTSATPFVNGPFDADNSMNVYFNASALSNGDTFRGGLFTDADADFFAQVENADFNYFVAGDGGGSTVFEGNNYYTLDEYALLSDLLVDIDVSTPVATANFASGTEVGRVMQFAVSATPVPEPASFVLWGMIGLAGMMLAAWRNRRRFAS